ncbi:MAG: WbqC family protein [Myxococcales bacterium]|nr:WbqC family protein [Myxococcales bacterium]
MLVAIHQPNYLPWCGYFAKIAAADRFIVLDDVPMPRGRSYLSRAQILGPDGPQWLSMPVLRGGQPLIKDARLVLDNWPARHLRTLRARYGPLSQGPSVLARLATHLACPCERLADFNIALLRELLSLLDIRTPLVCASELSVSGQGSRHLLDLVRAVGGTAYVSGPSGRQYLDEQLFTQFGIPIQYGFYEPRAYPQRGRRFVPALSIVDALCHLGPDQARALLDYQRTP